MGEDCEEEAEDDDGAAELYLEAHVKGNMDLWIIRISVGGRNIKGGSRR